MFLGMICSSELASVNVPQSSSTPSDKKKSPNIGTLNNFKWKAWLLVDTEIDPHELDADSSTQSRRITPKSVFVAPKIELSNCSEGYYADNMGRCVKNVNVNEDAHRIFLLERLNAQYALKPGDKNKNQSNGPLQLNIPLTSNLEDRDLTKIEKHELMETFSMNDSILLPVRGATSPDDEKKTQTQKEETASTMKKDTTPSEEDLIFFRKNFSAIGDASSKTDQKPVVMIPVVELVKESNDTDLLADYKIPLDMKTMLNILSMKGVDVSNVTEKDVSVVEKRQKNSTQAQPTTLVLLLSPTSLPNLDDDPSSTQTNTTDRTAQSNLTSSNTIAKEASNVSFASSSTVPPDAHMSTFRPDATSSTIPPKDSSARTEVAPIVVDEHRDNETHSDDDDELKVLENRTKLNESQQIGILYDEDEEDVQDYTYVTNEPYDEDESIEMENEEILKHGEAGITIPTRNMERMQQQNQTAANQNKTVDTRDRIMIHFNDTASADDDDDEAGSNVSSDVSIDGDRILETTLLDVNTERLQTTTRLPEIIVKSTKNDSKEELFDQRLSSESEVVFVNEELEAAPTSSESLLYDHPEDNPATQMSEEKLKKIVQENPRNIESDVSLIDLGQTTLNLDSTEDYVFFPDNVKRPQQDGYVRFPSNEANSIHGPTYKQQHPVDDHSFYGGTSTKSSVPVHQKPVYYLTRSSWKPDRPQRDHVPATTNKRRRPELSFWNKMPLIRDPVIYPVDQVPNDEAADDQAQHRLLRTSPSRRRSSYSEISSENMMLAQE